MRDRCLLYYITDRSQFRGDELSRRRNLLDKIAEAARSGVDYIQLREKDLSAHELELLAREAIGVIRASGEGKQPRFLINSRLDVALAAGADGVHLRADDISARDIRRICELTSAKFERPSIVARSCHSVDDLKWAKAEGADFVVFAPVFEKRDVPGARPTGLEALREACSVEIPVFALGGVTLQNAGACLEAGCAGIAGIRLFQEHDIEQLVQQLGAVLGSNS